VYLPSSIHRKQNSRPDCLRRTPVDDLAEVLLLDLAGMRFTARQIFERHSAGRLYIERNYRRTLVALEVSDRIVAEPPAKKRRVRDGEITFAKNVLVTFPKRKSR
jgi:hypothetical protein